MHVGRWAQRRPPQTTWQSRFRALTHSGLTLGRQTNGDACNTLATGWNPEKRTRWRVALVFDVFVLFWPPSPLCVKWSSGSGTKVFCWTHSILNSRLLSVPGGCSGWVYPWFVTGWALRRECSYHSQDFLSPWHLVTPVSENNICGWLFWSFLLRTKLSWSLKSLLVNIIKVFGRDTGTFGVSQLGLWECLKWILRTHTNLFNEQSDPQDSH